MWFYCLPRNFYELVKNKYSWRKLLCCASKRYQPPNFAAKTVENSHHLEIHKVNSLESLYGNTWLNETTKVLGGWNSIVHIIYASLQCFPRKSSLINRKAFQCRLPPWMRMPPQTRKYVYCHTKTYQCWFCHHMTNFRIKDYIIGISKM